MAGRVIRWVLVVLLVAAGGYAARAYLHSRQWLTPPRGTPEKPIDAVFEDVHFTTVDGVKLSGWWFPGSSDAAVVMVHGWGETRDKWNADAKYLVSRGLNVLAFDLRAHGLSGGAHSTMGDLEDHDVAAAIDFARAREGVARIGAVGFSIGGMALAEEASERGDLDVVVLVGTDPSMREGLRYDWGLFAFLPAELAMINGGVNVDHCNTANAVLSLRRKPLLVVIGENEFDSRMHPRLLEATKPEAKFWLVKGAGHGDYPKVAPEEWQRTVLDFVADTLTGR